MSGSAIETWLAHKQKKAVLNARFYFVGTSVVGVLALLPNFGIAFLICKLFLLLAIPAIPGSTIGAALLATAAMTALFVDCVRAERDDMAVIPLWLAREYFHMGPRIMFDGWSELAHAQQFSRLDTATAAQLLAYLLTKTTPTRREELLRLFPMLTWDKIVRQLRLIEGVIIFRNQTSVSLLTPLRLELRQLLAHFSEAEIPIEEPEPVPVVEPQKLAAHEILGVSANATVAAIKMAYRNRIKECHPDRFSQSDAQSRALAEEWTKALNAAYAELMASARS
ncbi:MAG TPA: J domain-containing protein [Verrucomicrobiae bacterium]|nr:J domain-containing protein [Verrucomicrobiae bacterium]